jgi:hypothetical protein
MRFKTNQTRTKPIQAFIENLGQTLSDFILRGCIVNCDRKLKMVLQNGKMLASLYDILLISIFGLMRFKLFLIVL